MLGQSTPILYHRGKRVYLFAADVVSLGDALPRITLLPRALMNYFSFSMSRVIDVLLLQLIKEYNTACVAGLPMMG